MLNSKEKTSDAATYDRLISSYVNCSDRFVVSGRTFERQYAPFYNARLGANTVPLKRKLQNKWGTSVPVKKLCDLVPDEEVIVVGTICKQMKLRPSILKEISEEHDLIPQPVADVFSSDDDFLILEDELQRIVLHGKINPHELVTGIVAAVRGHEQEDGKFLVQDICYSSVRSPTKRLPLKNDMYVLLISGLGLGSAEVLFPFQLLIDYINGDLGSSEEQEKASSIVRVIIAGNSICHSSKDKEFSNKAKYLSRKTKATTVDGIKSLDDFLAQLVRSIDVDLMPGEFDPANHLMPQQPLHPAMFPKSARYSTFHSVPNPYEAEIGGLRFLGTSGQNVKDIMAYSKLDEATDIMERTLTWGHMSPTAPDTLNCYPFFDKDPFCLSDSPHVYFCGNMPKLSCKMYGDPENPAMILSVPKFSETFTGALINLRSFSIEPFSFQF